MNPNLFIEAARAGRNEFWRYFLTILLAGAFALGGGVAVVLAAFLFTGSLDLAALPPAQFLALNILPFFLILGVLAAALPLLHGRPFFSLINPLTGRFHWPRFFLSAGLWLLLSAISDMIMALIRPGNYVFVFEPESLLPYLIAAVLLIPFQSAAEELLFRGYLTQGLGLAGGFWMAWLVPSLFFGLLHGANPEVGAYGVLLTLPLYIGTGLLLGWITLRSESLELALGLHIANNLYGTLLVTFPSSALPSPALFRVQVYDPLIVLVMFFLMAAVYLLLLHLLGKGFFRKALLGSLALLVLLTGCNGQISGAALAQEAAPAVNLEDCWLNAPGQAQVRAQCGRLTLPEDPDRPDGRQVEINLAVVKAVSRDPAPDPLFLLAGGPGQAATEAFLPVLSALERVRFKRDLVLVDQRGTGSSNPLDCPALEQTGGLAGGELPLDEQVSLLKECRAALQADPRFFTTEIAMRDLDQIRQALGYQQINLLGVSYGTRAALTYLRLYPERVRTLILDGVVPPGWALGSSAAADAQQALDAVFARCAADEACRMKYPGLPGEFDALLNTLERQPVEVTVAHPTSGEPVRVEMSRRTIGAAVRLMSYSDLLAALLPLAIHSAASGDYTILASQYILASQQLGEGMSLGMYYSVVCAEDAPFLPAEDPPGDFYFDPGLDELQAACRVWLPEAPPAPQQAGGLRDVPALLISGSADPVTPPANAVLAARHLPRSYQLVLPGMGHNNFYAGCVPGILLEFLETGSPDNLNSACAGSIFPQPFFLSPSGPRP